MTITKTPTAPTSAQEPQHDCTAGYALNVCSDLNCPVHGTRNRQSTSAQAEPELLPCPFCGGTPERGQRTIQREPRLTVAVASCMNRNCPMFCKNVNIEPDDYKTISWNTRAATPIPEVEAAQPETVTEVLHWAQAVLTALNVGDVQKDSKLHLKLREVMIAYRATKETDGKA